ncbi:hypothetical protein D6789_02315 [Candidatus Woesearchaeota archaeon]|nr:MAG: hypothetical protein D6789_02315 [Candidatus Woesearchaeota archaeon]
MAKKVVKKAGKAKIKKKWVPILAPKSFNNQTLGETHVASPEAAIGKTINANLMHLTGDMRKQGIEIRFDVVKVQDGKALTAVTGYELLPANLKRIVRRGRTKIADSFITRTATKRRVRIKPLIITTSHTSARTCTAIRHAVRAKLKELAGGMSFEKLVQELIGFKIQRAIKDAATPIHPIKTAEIRVCTLLPEGSSEKREIIADYRDEDFVEVKRAPAKAEAQVATQDEKPDEKSEDSPAETAAEEQPAAESAKTKKVGKEKKAEEKPAETPAKKEEPSQPPEEAPEETNTSA